MSYLLVLQIFICYICNSWGCLQITALLCKRRPPLGPMPNEEIDVGNLESLEKYRSYTRYFRQAKEADNRPVWWKTYRSYVEQADPEHGEKHKAHCGQRFSAGCRGATRFKRVLSWRRGGESGHRAAAPQTPTDQGSEGEDADDEGQQD